MNLLRTDKQVILQDLLVINKELVDHYRDVAAFVDNVEFSNLMLEIARRRESFIERFENCIRSLGDLTSEPDTDKETGSILLNHIQASLSSDSLMEIVEQRIEGEKRLIELIDNGRGAGLDKTCGPLLDELSRDVMQVCEQLRVMRRQAHK